MHIQWGTGNDFAYGHNEEVDDCAFSPLWAYADSLWVGESYNYHSNDADYWLIRMSGLNFGLFADMLGDDAFVSPLSWHVIWADSSSTSGAPTAYVDAVGQLWDPRQRHGGVVAGGCTCEDFQQWYRRLHSTWSIRHFLRDPD